MSNEQWHDTSSLADMVAAAHGMGVRGVATLQVRCPECDTSQAVVVEQDGYPGDRFLYDEWVSCQCCGHVFQMCGSAGYLHLPTPERTQHPGADWPPEAMSGRRAGARALLYLALFLITTAVVVLWLR